MQAEVHELMIRSTRSRRPNTVVVMAGGFGSRLGELTRNIPKPLIPVAGQPMLERIIHRMKSYGLLNYVLTTHYLPEKIRAHCGDGSGWGVNINYSHESTPLGTAGGLAMIRDVGDEAILVCNADILTDIDYSDLLNFHYGKDAALTVVTVPYTIQVPFGVLSVSSSQEIETVDEKPTYTYHVSAGTYVMNPEALRLIKPGERLDMPQLIERVKASGGTVAAYGFNGYWMDIGRPDDLQRAARDLGLSVLAS